MVLLLLLHTNNNNGYHLVTTYDGSDSRLFRYRPHLLSLHRKPEDAHHDGAHPTDAEREAGAHRPG